MILTGEFVIVGKGSRYNEARQKETFNIILEQEGEVATVSCDQKLFNEVVKFKPYNVQLEYKSWQGNGYLVAVAANIIK